MQRNQILHLLKRYTTSFDEEKQMQSDAISFIKRYPNCFERELVIGHVTGSSWIIDSSKTHALLIHHVKLDKWFQPGGHCDGDSDVLFVASKEATEETGLLVRPISEDIFDIDNHVIPSKNGVLQHTHYDIRFLFEADRNEKELGANSEVKSIRWIQLSDIPFFNKEPSMLRMVSKTQNLT